MTTNATRDNILRYLYNELEIAEKLEIENELSVNSEAQADYQSYKSVVDFMNSCTCDRKPSSSVTQSIIEKLKQA